MEKRGSFSTRLGFILVSAGCAIGLGNVWRFPYITGQYGGASFVLIYLVFLAILGLPIMVAEFAVGRASVRSAAMSFDVLEPKGTKWHLYKYGAIAGNLLLMMFYTTVSGWMFYYIYKMATGAFDGLDAEAVGGVFSGLLADPVTMAGCMILVVLLCGGVCYLGVEAGVERITKWMMVALMLLMIVLAVNSILLPNSEIGLKYYLYPDFSKVTEYGVQEVVFAAMGQAFFTLSLGIGALAIFGSYIGKSKRLTGEAIWVIVLDTFVAIMAGLIIFPACFSYGVNPGSGPNLLFATLQDVFHDMGTIGGIFGLIFYALVLIAAISSAISLIEAVSVTFIDHASAKGHERDRNKVLAVVCLAITLLACLVAVDGLGSNGIAPKDLFHINSKADWCADWLDFMDMLSEGIAMPLGALLMSIMVGWEIKPKSLYGEIDSGYNGHIHGYYTFCIKYLCPVIMFFILLVQISTFFGLGWFN